MDSKQSEELNGIIAHLDDSDGKVLLYVGWFWRNVDFTKPIQLGRIPGKWTGFMENNKWDYPEFQLTPEQNDHLIDLLLAHDWSGANEYMQEVTPESIKNRTVDWYR